MSHNKIRNDNMYAQEVSIWYEYLNHPQPSISIKQFIIYAAFPMFDSYIAQRHFSLSYREAQ